MRSLLVCAAVAGLTVGCSHVGEFVWVDAYKQPPPPSSAYVISPGDLIGVRVWNQEALSSKVRVRQDGMITLPFVNDVPVAGLEPVVCAKRLQARLKEFIVNPVVTVTLEEQAPLQISVVGEVNKPGVYSFEREPSVLNVLAACGGLTDMARRDRIFVLRDAQQPGGEHQTVRIRFNYEALLHVEGAAGKFRLRKGDMLVIE
jgi:polysaccharide export outer membrane protein